MPSVTGTSGDAWTVAGLEVAARAGPAPRPPLPGGDRQRPRRASRARRGGPGRGAKVALWTVTSRVPAPSSRGKESPGRAGWAGGRGAVVPLAGEPRGSRERDARGAHSAGPGLTRCGSRAGRWSRRQERRLARGAPRPGSPPGPSRGTRTPTGGVQRPRRGARGARLPGPCGSSTPEPALPVPTGLRPAWGGQTGARLDLTWEAEDRMVPSFSTESDHRPRPWRCCRQGEGQVPSQLTGSSPCRIRVSPLNAKHRTPPAAPTCTPPAPFCKLIPSRGPKHKQKSLPPENPDDYRD